MSEHQTFVDMFRSVRIFGARGQDEQLQEFLDD